MEFDELQALVGREPLFDASLLLAGNVDPGYLQRQLSEWVNAGKLIQLRRGLYALAPPYQKVTPHPFLIANRLRSGSYISLQAALAYDGLIPEHVEPVTSVTTGRPVDRETPLGRFRYRHVQPTLFFGYERRLVQANPAQHAFVARPEKALLDLVYLQPGGDSRAYLASLRLQNLERLDAGILEQLAQRTGKPKLERATAIIAELVQAYGLEYDSL